jgi:hypothetical protein
MKCPNCNHWLAKSNYIDELSIYYCEFCDQTFRFTRSESIPVPHEDFLVTLDDQDKVKEKVPDLEVATRVYVNNKEHSLFLEHGIIAAKAHLHYRVKMVSLNKEINGKFIWFPEHWIRELPKDLVQV